MGFIGNLFNRGKRVVGKTLAVGGSALKRISDVGGNVVKFLGNNAGAIGTVAGTGLSLMGFPEFGIPLAAGASAIGNFAKSKPVQNTVRGISDVGGALQQGGDILRR